MQRRRFVAGLLAACALGAYVAAQDDDHRRRQGASAIIGGGAPALPAAAFTMTQLPLSGQPYQADTETGGGQGVGTGTVPYVINVTSAGTLYARRRSIDGSNTILQAPWLVSSSVAVNNYTSGFPITGVDAPLLDATGMAPIVPNDGIFFLDLSGDGVNFTNGTVPILMGDRTFGMGQSLWKRGLNKSAGDVTLAAAGISAVSDFIRVFAAWEGNTTVASLVWQKPSDATATASVNSTVCTQYLNLMAAFRRRAQGLIAVGISGMPQDYFQSSNAGGILATSVLNTVGPKWKYDIWYQGHEDSKSGMPPICYQTSMNSRTSYYTGLNTFGGTVKRAVGCIPILNINSYGPPRLNNQIRAAQNAYAAVGANNAVVVNSEAMVTGDFIHEVQVGGVQLGTDIYRAISSDNIGPSVASVTRSGTTLTVTMNNLGTNLVVAGNWWTRFVVYANGSTQTKWPISGGSYSGTGNVLTLTLANDPGDGTVLDVWLGIPQDGDASTNDTTGLMIRDDRVATGTPSGRPFTPSIVATVVAAPNPGGTQNTPPGGVIAASSYWDMTGISAAFGASGMPGFGNMLTAGKASAPAGTQANFFPGTLVARIVAPATVSAVSAVFGAASGFGILLNTNRTVRVSFAGGTLLGVTALTPGNTYLLIAVQDLTNVRLYIQDCTGGVAGTVKLDASAAVVRPWAIASTTWFIGTLSTTVDTNSFFTNTTDGPNPRGIFECGYYSAGIYSGTTGAVTPTPPITPLVGNEANLEALFRSSSDLLDSVRHA